jgi:hypothetical protein
MLRAAPSTLLLVAVVFAATAIASEPIPDNTHPLAMTLTSSAGGPGRGLLLDAAVHNPTSRRIFLQVTTPDVFAIHATFVDAAGEPVEGMHTWANKGAPFRSHRFHELAGGEALVLDQFELIDAESRATGGGMRWDLRSYRGQTLALTFTFSQECSERTTERPDSPIVAVDSARPKRIKDVFCGELTTPIVEVVVGPWTRDNVLATLAREPILDPDAYDLLVADALTHESEMVRQHAAFSLGEIGRDEAAGALIPLLTDPVREVRGTAARSLGNLGNPEALPALEAAKTREQDDWVRGTIYRAIDACQR